MRIIAIDPGGTTGWATCEIDMDLEQPLWRPHIAHHFNDLGQLDQENHHGALRRLLVSKKPHLIICERYEKRNNEFSLLISCEYIGVVKEYSQQSKCRLVMQGASEAKKWSSNEKLHRLDLWIKPSTKWGHALDARRHLLYYLVHDLGSHKAALKILSELRNS